MIIGVDASKIAEKQKTGLGNTIYPIMLELKKIDKQNQYFLYTNAPLPKEILSDNFLEKIISFPKFWHTFKLPFALQKDRPDIFLSFTNPLVALAPEKSFVLLHDFAYKYFPKCYSVLERAVQEKAARRAVKKASRIIVTSQANKKDLIKFYHPAESKIVVVSLGFNSGISDDTETVPQVNSLSAPYFLSVGRLEKRKNTVNTIEAFGKFKEETKSSARLVLVGKPGFGFKEIKNKIASLPEKIKADIITLGFVNQKQLGFLYSKALALVYPSLYEGFGFPALEAMACGVPVITSDVPTIKEIAGKAALFVNPEKSDEIADAMLKIYQSIDLRSELISEGRQNIQRFSFEKTARDLLDLINEN